MPMTGEDFQAYLTRFRQPTTEGFLVCLRDGGAMAGIVTIDSIVRGRFQSATLSYAANGVSRRRRCLGLGPRRCRR